MKKTLRHIFMTRIGLWQATYFIGAIALILYFFPREEKSEYVFQEGLDFNKTKFERIE